MTLISEYDKVIKNRAHALTPRKRFVTLDFKLPSNRLSYFARLGVYITKPFGVSIEMASRHPWESLIEYLKNATMNELYGGFSYIATGKRRGVNQEKI